MKWMATLPWWASVIARSLFFSDPQFFSALDFDILDHRIIHPLFFFLIEPCVSLIAGLICMLLLAALALVIASSKLVCCLYIVGGWNLMAWKVKAISKSSEHFIIWFIQATTAKKHEKTKACWRGLPLTNGLNLLYWFASLPRVNPVLGLLPIRRIRCFWQMHRPDEWLWTATHETDAPNIFIIPMEHTSARAFYSQRHLSNLCKSDSRQLRELWALSTNPPVIHHVGWHICPQSHNSSCA